MHAMGIDCDTTRYTIYHDGDFSGDVVIDWSPPSKTTYLREGAPVASDTSVRLPFALLKTIVAAWVRDARINQLEEADSNEILLGHIGATNAGNEGES